MDIEKFTDRARGFLQAAQTIAIRDYHQRITPEHLTKALLDDEQGAAAGLIAAAGGDAAREMPLDVRDAVIRHYEGIKRNPGLAAAYLRRKGLSLSDADGLIFPPGFDADERRHRLAETGYPAVNRLHKLAAERGHDMADGRYQAVGDLCEPVPVGSEAYDAWRAWHVDRGLPLWPDPGQMPVVYFPKGGPEGMGAFVDAAKAAMAGEEGCRGDADAA